MSKHEDDKIIVTPKKVMLGYISMIGVMVFLFFGIRGGLDPQMPLIGSTILAATLAIVCDKQKWNDLERKMLASLSVASQAIIILMVIGMLIASWIAGGIVPTLIYYGLGIISPKFFFVTALLLCSMVSLAIGSSWTTAGTIGVALIGIATALGINPGLAAGAIVSGAYFGDKMSPLSDTTNLAPTVAGSNLFDHIKSMSYTTSITYGIVFVAYLIIGLNYNPDTSSLTGMAEFKAVISEAFSINPLLLVPPILIIVMVLFKIPAIPGLIFATILGMLSALFLQDGNSFVDVISMLHYGYEFDPTILTGTYSEKTVTDITNLLSSGGMDSMMWTVSLIISAMCFGGVMEGSGFLESVISVFDRFTKTRTSLIITTLLTCILVNIIAADQYLSIILPGRMYKSRFEALGIQPSVQSRCLEGSGTVTSALVPWNTCGATMASYLGVPTMAYLPFAFFNLLSPIMEILASMFNYGMTPIKNKE